MSYTTDVIGWYEAVQFRAPPPDELTRYVNELNNNIPTVTVQNEILKSPYTINVVNPVIQEYQAAFNRVPDQQGENYWVNTYGSGTLALSTISVLFANSPEFYSLYNANATTPANKTLVDAFYNNVFQRAPDAAGEAYWINSGLNASQLLQAFAQSPEMNTIATPYIVSYQFGEMAGTPQTSGSLIPSDFAVAAQWSGIARNDGVNDDSQVPDNALAVGPSNVVTAENSAILWTDLQGQNKVEKTFADFFSPITTSPNSDLYDPRIYYDSTAGRYLVVIDQGITPQNNHILVAASKDADPNHGWYYQSIATNYSVNGTTTWADYPMLSVDQSNIYITTNQFSAIGTPEEDQVFASDLTVLSKAGVYSGGISAVSGPIQLQIPATNNLIADPFGGSFIINYKNNLLNIAYINDVLTQFKTIDLGNIDTGSIINATQPNTDIKLDAGDGRIQNLAINNNHLYAVFEVQPTGGSSTSAVHWVDIDITNRSKPLLVNQGDILGSMLSPNATTFNGSIAVDKAGDIIINFNASGPTLLPNNYFIVHKAADPTDVFSSPVSYQASSAAYTYNPDEKGVVRWGDYSSAVADPNNATGFWISNEFTSNSMTWGTSIAQVLGLGLVA